MKAGWEYRTLGEVCDIIGGGTPAKGNERFYQNGTIPWATVRDMKSDIIDNTEFKIIPEAIKGSSTNIIPKGNIVIATRVGLGKACLLAQDTAINQDLKGIIPKKHSKLLVGYLFQWFKQTAQAIQDQGTGATVQGVKLPFIKSLIIPIPPIDEQQRIVTILDQAFDGIATAKANAEKNLKNARDIFESHLNAVFTQRGEGWVEKKLGDVCAISSKLVDPREPEFIDLPHLGAGNMVSMTGELVEIKTAREEGLKSGKFTFDESMVLYSKIRPYLVKVCRPDFSGLCSADVYPLFPIADALDRNYLFHLLMSRDFTDYAIAGSDRAGMPKVNRPHLFKYRAYFPEVPEQKRIAAKLDDLVQETRHLESIYQQKLNALDELKKSLLKQAFTGELTTLREKHSNEALT